MHERITAQQQSPNPQAGTGGATKKQTILLVEDEDMVRNLMREVLEREGYKVVACAHPGEGIELGRKFGTQIDLLLTDVVMPGMNGREMARRIHEFLPHLRVVFMSGYTHHALAQQGQVDPNFEYLQKPFTLKSLTQKLAAVLAPQDEHDRYEGAPQAPPEDAKQRPA